MYQQLHNLTFSSSIDSTNTGTGLGAGGCQYKTHDVSLSGHLETETLKCTFQDSMWKVSRKQFIYEVFLYHIINILSILSLI